MNKLFGWICANTCYFRLLVPAKILQRFIPFVRSFNLSGMLSVRPHIVAFQMSLRKHLHMGVQMEFQWPIKLIMVRKISSFFTENNPARSFHPWGKCLIICWDHCTFKPGSCFLRMRSSTLTNDSLRICSATFVSLFIRRKYEPSVSVVLVIHIDNHNNRLL